MVCKGGVWRDGGGGSLGGGVMVAAVFIFGYEKSDSGEPLFCLVCFQTVRDRLYAKQKFLLR